MREFLYGFKVRETEQRMREFSSVFSTVSYLRAKNARVLVRFLISAGNRARNARVLAWF